MKCPVCSKDKPTEYELAEHIVHRCSFKDKSHYSWAIKNKLKPLNLDGICDFLKRIER